MPGVVAGGSVQVRTCAPDVNHRRLLEPIGHIPRAEKEANYYLEHSSSPLPGVEQNTLRETRGGSITQVSSAWGDSTGRVGWSGARVMVRGCWVG